MERGNTTQALELLHDLRKDGMIHDFSKYGACIRACARSGAVTGFESENDKTMWMSPSVAPHRSSAPQWNQEAKWSGTRNSDAKWADLRKPEGGNYWNDQNYWSNNQYY
jgi:hypothetical protein